MAFLFTHGITIPNRQLMILEFLVATSTFLRRCWQKVCANSDILLGSGFREVPIGEAGEVPRSEAYFLCTLSDEGQSQTKQMGASRMPD